MLELYNQSPCAAGLYPGRNKDNYSQQTLVIKRSFNYDLQKQLTPCEPQPEIIITDNYTGNPGESSLIAVDETQPYKSGSELLIYGTAYPNENAKIMEVSVKLFRNQNLIWQKALRIFGKRYWQSSILGLIPSKPTLLEPLPLRYEYAYGGKDPKDNNKTDRYNPIGQGYSNYGRTLKGRSLPQIELAPKFITKPQQHPKPGGFGPIPADWEPRLSEQGISPDQPTDSNNRNASDTCFNTAPIDQRFTETFQGDETIMLKGLTQGMPSTQEIAIPLPKLDHHCQFFFKNKIETLTIQCDTVIIDTEEKKLSLIYRCGIPWDQKKSQTGWIIID